MTITFCFLFSFWLFISMLRDQNVCMLNALNIIQLVSIKNNVIREQMAAGADQFSQTTIKSKFIYLNI